MGCLITLRTMSKKLNKKDTRDLPKVDSFFKKDCDSKGTGNTPVISHENEVTDSVNSRPEQASVSDEEVRDISNEDNSYTSDSDSDGSLVPVPDNRKFVPQKYEALYKWFYFSTVKRGTFILDPVCHQLFEFYRSSEASLRLFSLDFIPVLIWLYLSSLSIGGKKEIVSSDGKPRIKTFRIPKFAQPSIYHEPSSIAAVTSDVALSRLDFSDPELWQSGPLPQYESLNGQNRQGVLAYIQQCYNADIANVSPQSHHMFCKASSKIANTGFVTAEILRRFGKGLTESPPSDGYRSMAGELSPRINISPALMIEMLSGLYYVTFNTELALGTKAIYDMHHRAGYELYPDVLLVTCAMTNTLQSVPSDSDNRVQSMTTVTPSSSGHAISKSAITNASFKIKKLPDDIAVIPDPESATKLSTIDEDGNPIDSTISKSASKSSKFNPFKTIQGKGEKSKGKESGKRDSIEMQAKSPMIPNGDNIDSVQVGVTKNNSRVIVDNIELQHPVKRNIHADYDSTADEKFNNSPSGASGTKHKTIGDILVSGAKDLKGKLGHHRHSSGSSVNSETYNTAL
ncbi:hypothetical protein FSP39_011027 [Pinctada imbricata]|uniref:Uncharacterized protein n=1 Tax=Pinctada imbricata TaxID=66713 RepID=A0AA88XE69_PINIB|nr:hypothetical protein FSP39_011027 [Pinctada imbricata]